MASRGRGGKSKRRGGGKARPSGAKAGARGGRGGKKEGGDRRRGKDGNDRRSRGQGAASRFPEEAYPEHWSEGKAEEALAAGRVFRGKLRVQPVESGDALHGFVAVEGAGLASDVYVKGFLGRNRAKHGDVVVLELLPEEAWRGSARTEADAARRKEQRDERVLSEAMAGATLSETTEEGAEAAKWLTAEDRAEMQMLEQEQAWYADAKQQSIWAPMAPRAAQVGAPEWGMSLSDVGKRALDAGLQPAGRVVAILEAAPLVDMPGCLRQASPDRMEFVPDGGRHTRMKVDWGRVPECFRAEPERYAKSKFLATQDANWPVEEPMPLAGSVRLLGEDGSIEVETIALLLEHNVIDNVVWGSGTEAQADGNEAAAGGASAGTTGEAPSPHLPVFPQAAIDELAARFGKHWEVSEADLRLRRDFRGERIFTIDPWSAKDLDDALHVKLMEDGTVEMGVHIADVTHFVSEGTALDAEARRRATSVYLVNRVIHMLPKDLSQDYCSLNPNVARLTFSCVWRMNLDGTLVKDHEPWFGRGVIRSCCKLDYGTAQRMIEGTISAARIAAGNISEEEWAHDRRPMAESGQTCEGVVDDVLLMNRVAVARRALRKGQGAMQLHNAKLSFVLDPGTQNPEGVTAYPIRDSNRLIEEYMLLANYLVAQQMLRAAPARAVLRRHRCPDPEELAKTNEKIRETFGTTIPGDTSAAMSRKIAELQATCRSRADLGPIAAMLIMELCTMPMQLAQYCCRSCLPEGVSPRHFALNIPYYTHFTSPIRRYADILVHRVLQSTLDDAYRASSADDEQMLGPDKLQEITDHCNVKNLNAKNASRDSDLLFLRLFVRDRPMVERAVISGIGKDSFQLSVLRLGISHRVYARAPPLTDAFQSEPFNETEQSMLLLPRNGSKSAAFLEKLSPEAENTEHARFERIAVKMLEQVFVLIHSRNDRDGKEVVDVLPLRPIPLELRGEEVDPQVTIGPPPPPHLTEALSGSALETIAD